jgi:dihydrolipoamide dehydrogenase
MAEVLLRKNNLVSNSVTGIEKLLHANGVERVKGFASLLDKNTVLVDGEPIKGRNLLLATGSIPASPALLGMDLPGVVTSDGLLEMDKVPERLAIIGGGVMGLEFACIFNAFGSQVTVFEYMPELLNTMDNELGKRMRVFLKKQNIEVYTSATVQGINSRGGRLCLTASTKKGSLETEADIILFAGGRKANTKGMNLEKLGIELDEKGFIKVDRHYLTNVEGVYAIGDVIGGPMLAHAASEEGIAAVENMAGMNRVINYQAIPACAFTFPEIATVGFSEAEIKAQGMAYRTGKFQFSANGKAQTMGETEGMVKVLADSNDRILGMHIIGPHASDLIMEGVMMVKNQLTVSDVVETVHPHPTLSEAVAEAVKDVYDQSIHLLPSRR